MNESIKSKIPLLFLLSISISWGFYYQSDSWLNDYGHANFEWLFLLDALLVLPIVCFMCVKNNKQAILKAVVLVSLAIWVASYIIPEQNKLLLNHLESGRYLVMAAILALEIAAVMTVYFSIKVAIGKDQDPDISIDTAVKRYLGDTVLAKVFSFETRMWTFAFFAKRIKAGSFHGRQHFSYHQKDGAKSNLLGFIFLIALEVPLMHLFLHYVWSPFGANIITLLTLASLVFFVAEYRAVSRRPVSLVGNELVIRYGLYHSFIIPLNNIANIQQHDEYVARAQHIKRYNYSGNPNVKIELKVPQGAVESVFIGLDNPGQFISAVVDSASLTPQYNN
ncbi:hypothetical protein L1285_23110 [Pseudoalteromonas sp. DL2-H2.2]|uniref:hypothetical protein n=1 Tax=Pseudoalteromonas sp. DL2-H2.2 TaxID=2908889 RepID=UPI001F28E6D7|nr:hypothetical protein [Pseudoalteromonas sp. DL2-H2.2]MCF2911193.1 hypothetical protein [Pseudoalteromonas sp. DL2-H2.2]